MIEAKAESTPVTTKVKELSMNDLFNFKKSNFNEVRSDINKLLMQMILNLMNKMQSLK